MATIGEVYNPLIEIGKTGDKIAAAAALRSVGEEIFKNNPDRCPDIEDGIRAAGKNLDYYCQYFSDEVSIKVKDTFEIGSGFRDLAGNKY